MDHETERSRGTGFVCFWKQENADEVLEESKKMVSSFADETNGGAVSSDPKFEF